MQWCDQQPLLSLESWRRRQQSGNDPVTYAQILEAMIQSKCKRTETHKKGSNDPVKDNLSSVQQGPEEREAQPQGQDGNSNEQCFGESLHSDSIAGNNVQ